jgi:hypothetical protein
MNENRNTSYHALILDECTDSSVNEMLFLYIKFLSSKTKSYKTMFAGITQISICDSKSIFIAIKQLYIDNQLDLQK